MLSRTGYCWGFFGGGVVYRAHVRTRVCVGTVFPHAGTRGGNLSKVINKNDLLCLHFICNQSLESWGWNISLWKKILLRGQDEAAGGGQYVAVIFFLPEDAN